MSILASTGHYRAIILCGALAQQSTWTMRRTMNPVDITYFLFRHELTLFLQTRLLFLVFVIENVNKTPIVGLQAQDSANRKNR